LLPSADKKQRAGSGPPKAVIEPAQKAASSTGSLERRKGRLFDLGRQMERNSPIGDYIDGHGMSMGPEDQSPSHKRPLAPRWGFSFLRRLNGLFVVERIEPDDR
jgi:hypothetical protein